MVKKITLNKFYYSVSDDNFIACYHMLLILSFFALKQSKNIVEAKNKCKLDELLFFPGVDIS